MEIRRVSGRLVSFKKIAQGHVFLFDREHYMKVESFRDYVNAVNLFTGQIANFEDNDIVSPVDDCYLAIE